MLQLRDYQDATLEALRKGFAEGHRTQILYAPTGAGKTEMAIALLDATKKKLNKAAMVLDRIVLCNQTSTRLDKYKIDHGVMQSGHWRYRPYERIQVCSAQTLERRKDMPDLQLLIVDEAHQTRDQTVQFIKNNPNVRVIGLSATPFTKGLGNIYQNVISTVTTKSLVDKSVLVPLRVYIAKEIDMDGAKKVAGEWSQSETTTRGMKITGDIVSEWIKKTHEIFGAPKKTVVFCSGVEHGIDLARKFAEQGYNFVSISYRDKDEFKEDVIKDFSRPDTEIHGLIATDILTKGFDCVLEGSRVLTDRGLVAVDKLLSSDKIWDGVEYVSHGGAIYKGVKNVITYAGLTATEDHQVKTASGWRAFGECARLGIQIVTTGNGQSPIQEHEGCFQGGLFGKSQDKPPSAEMSVPSLWSDRVGAFVNAVCASMGRMHILRSAPMAGSSMQSPASPMYESITRIVSKLRSKRNSIQLSKPSRSSAMGKRKSWLTGEDINQYSFGQNQQQWSLRSWEFALVNTPRKQLAYAKKQIRRAFSFISGNISGNTVFRQNAEKFDGVWPNGCADYRKISTPIRQTQGHVWDVLNCGPRNRFTCEGLLIHNCADVMIGVSARPFSKSLSSHIQQMGRVMRGHEGKGFALWLDHSGNYLRFREDWEDVYANGVHALDDGKEKTRKELTKAEKEASKCPKCGALWTGGDTCHRCGHIKEKKNQVSSVAGELQELSGTMGGTSKQDFWYMMQYYKRYNGWSDGRMAHTYRDKFGVWPRGLDASRAIEPNQEVKKFVDKKLRSYISSIKRGGLQMMNKTKDEQ